MKHSKCKSTRPSILQGKLVFSVRFLSFQSLYMLYKQKIYYSATDFQHSEWKAGLSVPVHINLLHFFIFFFNFYFYFILLYNTVLVLPYIDKNQPQVYVSSQSWTHLPPPTPYHLFGSSLCTSPKQPVSCIEHRLEIRFFGLCLCFLIRCLGWS